MPAPTTTSSLTMQDFFSTTLSANITASDTIIPLNAVPSGTEGFLVIDQDNASREVIYFNSAGMSSVTCPSATTGRGQGGTTATTHQSGATVKMNVVSQYWTELQNGHAVAAGFPIQVADTLVVTTSSGTTIIPEDDTIPQSTEGDQYMTLSFTPKLSTSKLYIDVLGNWSTSVAQTFCVALFKDSDTSASAVVTEVTDSADGLYPIRLGWSYSPASTSSITFKVRAGGGGAGTTRFNSKAAGRVFGGKLTSFIRVTEVHG